MWHEIHFYKIILLKKWKPHNFDVSQVSFTKNRCWQQFYPSDKTHLQWRNHLKKIHQTFNTSFIISVFTHTATTVNIYVSLYTSAYTFIHASVYMCIYRQTEVMRLQKHSQYFLSCIVMHFSSSFAARRQMNTSTMVH